MEKAELRRQMIEKRNHINAAERRLLSDRICQNLESLSRELQYSQIIAYWPIDGEVNILPFLQERSSSCEIFILALEPGKLVKINHLLENAQPVLNWKELKLIEAEARVPISQLNQETLVITPGLAFSKDGSRIGYGGGFFDKLFSEKSLQLIKVGVCFSFQIQTSLPQETNDQKVAWIITEKQIHQVRV